MTDIAQLGIAVDTSQTTLAARELDRLTAAGGRAEGATKSLGNTSRQSMAEMASASSKAAQAMERMAASQERQEKLTQQMARQMQELTGALQGNATANNVAAQAASNAAQALGQQAKAAKDAQSAADSAAKSTQSHSQALASQSSTASSSAESFVSLGAGVRGFVGAMAVRQVYEFGKAIFDASASAERLRTSLDFSTGGRGAAELAYITKTANSLGLELQSTAKSYAQLSAAARGTSLEGAGARAVFEGISKAAAVVGMTAEQTGGAINALQQMISKGSVQSEELRGQLAERLPGAFQTAARAMGVTTAELGKMLENGMVPASEFIPKFAAQLEVEYGGAAEKAADRLDASTNKMVNSWNAMKTAIGDSGISKAIAGEMTAIAQDLTVASEAMVNVKNEGGNAFTQLAVGAAELAGRAGFGLLNTASNTLNGTINLLTGNVLALRTDLAYVPDVMKTNAQQASIMGGEMEAAKNKLARLQELDKNPANGNYFKTAIANTQAYINTLGDAIRKRNQLERGGAGADVFSPSSVASQVADRVAAVEKERKAELDAYTQKDARQTKQMQKEEVIAKARKAHAQMTEKFAGDEVALSKINLALKSEIANAEEKYKPKADSGAAKAQREENKSLKERQTIYAEIADVSSDYYSKLSSAQKQLKSGGVSEADYVKYVEDLIQKQPFATAQVKAATEAWKEQEKDREKASKAVEKAFEDEVKGAEKSAQAVTNKVAQMQIENQAAQEMQGTNLSLAQSIENVMIARLEEQKAYAKATHNQEMLDSIQAEIEARKQLIDQIGEKESRDASTKAAKEAEKDWEAASKKINGDLTDALMRGFESGKDFAKNARDTISNMFKTLILKPTVSAIMSPIAGAMAGPSGGGAAGAGASSVLSAAGSLFGAGGAAGALAAGAGWVSGATTLAGSLGAGASLIGTGTVAGAASGAGMIVGALAPIALGIGALVAIGNATRGETRTGSRLETTAAGTRYAEGPSGGRLNASLEDKITKQTFDGINNLLKNLGSKEVLGRFVSGLETSDKGRGGVFAGGALSSGATFGDVQNAADYKFNVDLKAEDAIKAYTAELNIATVEALKAATDLPKYAQRVLGGLDMKKLTPEAAVEALQVISDYPNKILELAGTSRDALVTKFTEGMMDKEVSAQKAGQNVADMLVASIEQSVYQRGMGQIFDIVNQGIITPVLDAMVTGAALSETISQESIDATIARATAAATALGSLFENEQFQNVLAGLKTTVGAALGNAAGQVGYEPKYQIDAAKELDKAAQDAAKAAEDAKKKWQDITDSLLGDKTQLGIDLLRTQGKEEAAVAAERAKATEGYDAYQISLYDANQAMKKQISTQESLNALNSESADLQIQLMQVQEQQEQATTKARQLATKGMGDAEVAIYDYNKSLEKQIANQEQLNGLRDDAAILEIDLLRALGKEENALAREREIAIKGMDDLSIAQYDANQSARKLIGKVQDLSSAFDSAVSALASPEQKMSMGYVNALKTLSDAGLNVDIGQAQTYTNAQLLEFVGIFSQMGDVSGETRTKVIGAIQAIGELNNQALDTMINGIQKESDTRIAAWQKELNVAQERAGIEQTALQLIGNTNELRKRELDALDATNRALQERVYAVQDASDGVDKALALVQRSVDAEKTAISKTAQAQIDAINDGADARSKAIDAAKKSVTDLTGIFDDITSAVKTLRQQVAPEAMQMAQARAYISMALSVAQAGGQVNSDRLKESLAVVTKDTADTYATGAEFRFTQAKQANELERLGNAMGAQKDKAQATLDAAEKSVTLAAEQIKAIEKARDDQIAALDAQLKTAQDSVSVMRGVDISVIGVGDAVGALDRAMAVYEAVRDALAREQLSAGQNAVNRLDAIIVADKENTDRLITSMQQWAAATTAAAQQQAQAAIAAAQAGAAARPAPVPQTVVSGGAASAGSGISNSDISSYVNQVVAGGGSAMDIYNAAQQYGVSSGQLAAATGVSQSEILAWTTSQNLPSFDVGTNYVPRDMIAQIHEGEAIVPKAFNPAANGGADNSELISEIRNLRAEVQRLQQIAQTGNIEQRRAADAVNGRPEAPMLVAVVETV